MRTRVSLLSLTCHQKGFQDHSCRAFTLNDSQMQRPHLKSRSQIINVGATKSELIRMIVCDTLAGRGGPFSSWRHCEMTEDKAGDSPVSDAGSLVGVREAV